MAIPLSIGVCPLQAVPLGFLYFIGSHNLIHPERVREEMTALDNLCSISKLPIYKAKFDIPWRHKWILDGWKYLMESMRIAPSPVGGIIPPAIWTFE